MNARDWEELCTAVYGKTHTGELCLRDSTWWDGERWWRVSVDEDGIAWTWSLT